MSRLIGFGRQNIEIIVETAAHHLPRIDETESALISVVRLVVFNIFERAARPIILDRRVEVGRREFIVVERRIVIGIHFVGIKFESVNLFQKPVNGVEQAKARFAIKVNAAVCFSYRISRIGSEFVAVKARRGSEARAEVEAIFALDYIAFGRNVLDRKTLSAQFFVQFNEFSDGVFIHSAAFVFRGNVRIVVVQNYEGVQVIVFFYDNRRHVCRRGVISIKHYRRYVKIRKYFFVAKSSACIVDCYFIVRFICFYREPFTLGCPTRRNGNFVVALLIVDINTRRTAD